MSDNSNNMYEFKAYIKHTKTIETVNVIDWNEKLLRIDSLLPGPPWLSFDEVVLLPFTTLQEVFKNDLLAVENHGVDKVFWNEAALQWQTENVFTGERGLLCDYVTIGEHTYIVGNANTPEGKQIIESGKW